MPPTSSTSGANASSSAGSFSRFYNGSFLPASLGNSVACYSGATFSDDADKDGNSGSKSNSSKGKGKASERNGKGKASGSTNNEGDVKFAEFDTLKRSRRAFTTETYTVYASLQIINTKFREEALEDVDHRALALRNDDVPKPEQVAYFSRFMQLYRDSIGRHLLEISSQNDIDTDELALVSALRDTFHLAHLVYVPVDGRGDGIASEEIVDWLNTTSPFPSSERRDNLSTMAAPYEDDDFWPFVYSCILRGHFELASTILDTLSNHPSSALVRLTQACADLLADVPRSTSPIYTYETAFLQAIRSWRNKATSLLARLEVEMDEFQEEIEALGDSDADACADERLGWQSGFSGLLKLLTGNANAISEASEDGWRSALAAWCLLVRPGLKRDDLPETIDAIVEKNPLDQTLFKEAMSIALLSGDIPKVLRLAADEDTWLVTHLCDVFAKLGLLRDSTPVENVTLRDWFILSYTDILMSDPGLWRITVDYFASLDNIDLGLGRMREYLLSIGSTSPIEMAKKAGNGRQEPDGNGEGKPEEDQTPHLPVDGMDVVVKVRKETTKKLRTSVEDVLSACAIYGLEDVARSVCVMTAEALVSQKKYGHAIAYCVRANDGRRINKICDLILDEYIANGDAALALIDSIPTSLLRPSSVNSDRPGSSHATADIFQAATPGRPGFEDDDMDLVHEHQDQSELHRTALALVASTRLGFLARYRHFHALYAAGERTAAAELLVLLMSSNAAPKQFWAVMLLDSVALLIADEILVSEQDTLELMRCLNEIVTPIEKSGNRDIYGHLTYLTRAVSAAPDGPASTKDSAGAKTKGQQQQQQSTLGQKEKVEAALRQLEVVRYSLTQNIARCFMQQA